MKQVSQVRLYEKCNLRMMCQQPISKRNNQYSFSMLNKIALLTLKESCSICVLSDFVFFCSLTSGFLVFLEGFLFFCAGSTVASSLIFYVKKKDQRCSVLFKGKAYGGKEILSYFVRNFSVLKRS